LAELLNLRHQTFNTEFDSIGIGLASPEMIRSWSYGEVKKNQKRLIIVLLSQNAMGCFVLGFLALLKILNAYVVNTKDQNIVVLYVKNVV